MRKEDSEKKMRKGKKMRKYKYDIHKKYKLIY